MHMDLREIEVADSKSEVQFDLQGNLSRPLAPQVYRAIALLLFEIRTALIDARPCLP